jgi:adenylyl cyclase-associated protein
MNSAVPRRQSILHPTLRPPPSLTHLLRRLEAATSRLEDIATSVAHFEHPVPTPASDSSLHVNGTPTPPSQLTPTPSKTVPPSTKAEDLPEEIEDFDKLISGDLAAFVKLSTMESLLEEQAQTFKECFEAERAILLLSTKAKKPVEGSDEYIQVYTEIGKKMSIVTEIRENNRASPLKDHLALVADGVQTLGWVAVGSKPAEQAAELFGGAQMYGNKLLKAHKGRSVITQSLFVLSIIDCRQRSSSS